MLSRAFWTVGPARGELRTETLPDEALGMARLRTLASGVSRGTERLVFEGRVPSSQYATMRAPLMAGAFPFPVKYGYSAVGRDAEGRRFFVLHPHQEHLVAPAAMCVGVPDGVPTRRAVLAANMETALNIVWDAAPLPGERVTIIGAGVVGLLAAALIARIPGVAATVVDIDASRAESSRSFGCRFAMPDAIPSSQDLVVHASGSEDGIRRALGCAAFEARIVEASWFGDRAPALPLGEAFHAKRLRLISSQVGHVAPAMRERRTRRERLELALALLADPGYDVLLEPPTPFEALPETMPRLLAHGLCHVVTYRDE
ncbi:MAG TPA: zinc-binding alcohol dehydrogenase [Acetobacteraceae bacterium]|nr:zinc-binding alcohol dehydrogenase [Acetobacteraceae bacterium]